ncbi:MAG: hypothetical protein CL862_13700 [Cyanobium sp. NAT70]|nr:hypothetical protein [Cyanobium sp. NAT70]
MPASILNLNEIFNYGLVSTWALQLIKNQIPLGTIYRPEGCAFFPNKSPAQYDERSQIGLTNDNPSTRNDGTLFKNDVDLIYFKENPPPYFTKDYANRLSYIIKTIEDDTSEAIIMRNPSINDYREEFMEEDPIRGYHIYTDQMGNSIQVRFDFPKPNFSISSGSGINAPTTVIKKSSTTLPRIKRPGRADPTIKKTTDPEAPVETMTGGEYEFFHVAGDQSSYEITFEDSQQTSYTTTHGATTEDSTSGSKMSSFTTSLEVKEGFLGSGAGLTETEQNAWESAWGETKEINFSKNKYDGQTKTIQRKTTQVPGSISTLKDRAWYKLTILETKDVYNNTFQNSFKITGNEQKVLRTRLKPVFNESQLPTCTVNIWKRVDHWYQSKDKFTLISDFDQSIQSDFIPSADISTNTAEALNTAKNFNYSNVEGATADGLDNFNLNANTILFEGSIKGVANINQGSEPHYSLDSSRYSPLPGGSVAGKASRDIQSVAKSRRRSQANNPNHVNLKDYSKITLKKTGIHHRFDTQSDGKKSIFGSGQSDIVYASKKGTHSFSSFKDSFLHGNSKKDTFVFNKNASNNHIHAFAGDDYVKTASSQTVNLGVGNDTYKILSDARKGSEHQISTGEGRDKLIVASKRAQFNITDYNIFSDKVVAGKGLDPDLLTGELVNWDGVKTLGSAMIQFKYDDQVIGTAHFLHESKHFKKLLNSTTYDELVFMNPKYYDQNQGQSKTAFEALSDSIENGITANKFVTPRIWASISNRKRAKIVHQSMAKLGSEKSKEYWYELLESNVNPSEFALDMFI